SRERGKEKAVAQRSPVARFIDSNRSAPSPLAGEGWGGGHRSPTPPPAPIPAFPRKRGRSTPAPAPHPCIAPFRRHPCPMYLPSPHDPHDPETQRAADRRRLGAALRGSIAFVLLLLIVFGVQGLGDYRAFAVAAGAVAGLPGVLSAPLLHGSPEHLVANAAALLILGTLALSVYPRATVRGLPRMWLVAGLGAWLLGEPDSFHLGASGLTHGLMFLLF